MLWSVPVKDRYRKKCRAKSKISCRRNPPRMSGCSRAQRRKGQRRELPRRAVKIQNLGASFAGVYCGPLPMNSRCRAFNAALHSARGIFTVPFTHCRSTSRNRSGCTISHSAVSIDVDLLHATSITTTASCGIIFLMARVPPQCRLMRKTLVRGHRRLRLIVLDR